jgi:hypothetical protein
LQPIRPSAQTLFGPRGAVLAAPGGPLFVCDTGHHRVLGWQRKPERDATPADIVLGQRTFEDEGRNGGDATGPTTLSVPTGIAATAEVLAVADAWNHRVLLWFGLPTGSQRPPDVVVGQAGFSSGLPNRGGAPAADSLNWCYGVALCAGRLIVADTGNRRVLVWNEIPRANGVAADLVLGQPDFTSRDGDVPLERGMRWPHAALLAGERLFVADAGTSRIMSWSALPHANGAPCDTVFGHAAPAPDATTLNMPYSLAPFGDHLMVADTANSRLLGFERAALGGEMAAARLSGQPAFEVQGDNRWGPPARDSLCWPYAVATCGTLAVVADTGNDRVLLWESA